MTWTTRFFHWLLVCLLAGPLASPGWGHTRVESPARTGAQVLDEWQGGMAENPLVQRSIAYSYDLLSQLKKESRSASATAEVGEINYGLGPTGNRLSRATTTSVGTTPNLPTVVRTTPATGTQTFDANDRSGAPNVYDSAGQALRVDLDGDGTVDQAADSTYDYEGRLVYYRRAAQGSVPATEVVLVYDGDGNRIRKQVRVLGVNTRNFTKYVVHAQSPTGYAQSLEEWTVSVPDNTSPAYALNRRYYYGTRLLRQDRVASAATDYYTYDGLGSVRTLVQLGGSGWTESATYVYDAFGVLIASPTSTANNYQYAGEYWDTDLGLYFLRARYYNPGDGRFLTMDTFQGNNSDPLSLHKYLYTQNNPVNMVDPSGHFSTVEVSAVSLMKTYVFNGVVNVTVNKAASAFLRQDYSANQVVWDFGLGGIMGVGKIGTSLASQVLLKSFRLGGLGRLAVAGGKHGVDALISTAEAVIKNEALPSFPPNDLSFSSIALLFEVNFTMSVVVDAYGGGAALARVINDQKNAMADAIIANNIKGLADLRNWIGAHRKAARGAVSEATRGEEYFYNAMLRAVNALDRAVNGHWDSAEKIIDALVDTSQAQTEEILEGSIFNLQ